MKLKLAKVASGLSLGSIGSIQSGVTMNRNLSQASIIMSQASIDRVTEEDEYEEDSSSRSLTPDSQKGCHIKFMHEEEIYETLARKPTLKKIMMKDKPPVKEAVQAKKSKRRS